MEPGEVTPGAGFLTQQSGIDEQSAPHKTGRLSVKLDHAKEQGK
jgi:hypothetical protein